MVRCCQSGKAGTKSGGADSVQQAPHTGTRPSASIGGCELHGAPHKTRQGREGRERQRHKTRRQEQGESSRHQAAAAQQPPPAAPTRTAPPTRMRPLPPAGAQSRPAIQRACLHPNWPPCWGQSGRAVAACSHAHNDKGRGLCPGTQQPPEGFQGFTSAPRGSGLSGPRPLWGTRLGDRPGA